MQDLKSQLLEEELRNQDRNAALLEMEAEAKRYSAYLDLSREEALQAARRIDPGVTEAQIVPAELSVTFTYRLGGPNARLTPLVVHADTHNVIARRPRPVQATR